ncbi:MAG: helix-turn-helix transcriptional regulator [Thermotaleaceae bacterium]
MDDRTSLTPQEVADLLKIAKNTVYELIKRGELNAYRIGRKVRVDLEDVEAYKNNTKSIKNLSLTSQAIAPLAYKDKEDFLYGNTFSKKDFVICGQDVILDILSRYLQQHPRGVRALRSYVGSYNGLYGLYLGEVQVATAHLWDGETNEYNVPYVRRLVPGISTAVIHLAVRMQGFYVAKGNPKGIKGWEDLKRPDIRIINREKGSGTRILLDEHLRLLGIQGKNIEGYERECLSHLAVASAVARGGADLALGNEKTGLQVQGIDFIPLQKERYDMVVKKEDLDTPPFEAILSILHSSDFEKELSGIGGYDLSDLGKMIIIS